MPGPRSGPALVESRCVMSEASEGLMACMGTHAADSNTKDHRFRYKLYGASVSVYLIRGTNPHFRTLPRTPGTACGAEGNAVEERSRA
eukprot:1781681-Rhodomonas_salina.2